MRFPNRFKKPFFFIISVLALFLVIQLLAGWYIKGSITKIEKELDKATNGTYHFKIEDISVNLFSRSVTISNTEVYSTSKNKNQSYFYAQRIVAGKINFASFFLKKRIEMGKIHISKPDIYLKFNPESNNTKSSLTSFSLYNLFKPQFNAVFVEDIVITDAHIEYFKNFDDSVSMVSTKRGDVHIKNLRIDSVTTYAKERWFEAKEFDISLKNLQYTLPDSTYILSFHQINISYIHSMIVIDSFQLIPAYGKYEFAKKAGRQTDRITALCKNILMMGFNTKNLLEKRQLAGKKIILQSLKIHAFRDKNIARVEKRIPTFQELLKKINLKLNIDSLVMVNSEIAYEEHAREATSPGEILFKKAEAIILNLYNDSIQMQNKTTFVRAKCLLMGKADLNAAISFPLDHDGVFSCSGKLGEMKLEDLNSVLEKNAFIFATEGKIDSMHFSFQADKLSSKGTMKLAYHDLKVAVKNKKTDDTTAVKERVVSFIANNIVLKKNNPEHADKLRKANMYYERNPNRFIFNYCWKTLLSGIKTTIGVKPDTEDKEKN